MDSKQLAEQAYGVVLADRITDHVAFAQETVQRFDEFVNPGILKVRKSVVEAGDESAVEWTGEGSLVTDVSGREWIDCLGGYGIYNFGIRNPDVAAAVHKQLDRSPLHTQELLDPLRAILSELLVSLAPGDLARAFLCNSGTEAVEAALKLAMWNTGRHTFISTENGFHGKTLGSLATMGKEHYRKPFQPALMQSTRVPFGDADAMEAALAVADPKPAAVIIEPVQGEGGAITPPEGYFTKVRESCDRHDVLLIVDEVQTGVGRCGTFYAIEQEGITPDIMTLGKSLGGGAMPIGGLLSTKELWKVWEPNPYIHSNTFGGNPLSCAAAIAAINFCLREDAPGQAIVKGEKFKKEVGALAEKYPDILDKITGRGLLLAMHFKTNELGYAVAAGLFHRGVLVAGSTANALAVRIEPALTIPDTLIDRVIQILADTLDDISSK